VPIGQNASDDGPPMSYVLANEMGFFIGHAGQAGTGLLHAANVSAAPHR
jgi:hypothetical protein